MPDPEDQRAQNRDAWNASAAAWKANADVAGRMLMPVSEWLIDAISPQPGHSVLELAAGTGEVGFLAAELIQPGGELICSDFSPGMLTAAQERAGTLGISNVRFKQIDAESIDLPAASVDSVLCRFGYMLMVDANAALRETRRVLKPGGVLALAVWAQPEANPWLTMPAAAVGRHARLEPVPPGEPGPFRWGEEGLVARQLEAAGFVDFEVEAVELTYTYLSHDKWWEVQSQMSSRIRAAVADLDAGTVEAIRDEIATEAAAYVGEDGSLQVPARTWNARAVA